MVTALTYLQFYPSTEVEGQLLFELTSEDSDRLDELATESVHVLAPITRVSSKDVLEGLLQSVTPRFLPLKAGLVELLWPYLADQDQSADMYETMRQLAKSKTDLLGSTVLEVVIGTIDSVEGLHDWSIKAVQAGGPAIYRLESMVQQVGESVQRADVCMTALLMILSDQLSDWEPSAIPILAQAADRHISVVEDAFLAQSGVAEPDDTTIPYDQMRTDLAL
jgi:hypothetical protein